MVLENVSYFMIFGKPLTFYLGVATVLSLLFTSSIPSYFMRKGKFNLKVHKKFAKITILLALIHGGLSILNYF